MVSWFVSGGVYMFPILLIALVIVYVAIRAFTRVTDRQTQYHDQGTLIALGAACPVIGLLGQIMGVTKGMAAIIVATDISPAIVMKGFGQAGVPTTFGLAIFLITLVVWFVLRERSRRITA